jgi:hypothetical protein
MSTTATRPVVRKISNLQNQLTNFLSTLRQQKLIVFLVLQCFAAIRTSSERLCPRCCYGARLSKSKDFGK